VGYEEDGKTSSGVAIKGEWEGVKTQDTRLLSIKRARELEKNHNKRREERRYNGKEGNS